MTGLTVAHFCPAYLPLSETFIYRYLSAFRQVSPIVLAGQLANRGQFPLPHPIYDCSHRRFTTRWLGNGIGRHVFGVGDFHRKRLLRRHRARIMHAHFGPVGHGLLDLKRDTGLPLITTFYGYDMSSLPKQPVWQRNYARLFAEGDLFLVEGPHMRKDLIALGCPDQKVQIQHIAVDTDQFKFRAREPKGQQEINLFFCGRFAEKKGLIYALMAFKEALADHPNLRFRIVGDGERRPQIEEFIAQNDLSATVTLLGYQPQDVVVAEMDRADIFIHPSVTAASGDTEGGAPTIILEAQASGVPILSTYHADIPAVVREGASALLSPERDWQTLAANLDRLVRQQDCWAAFGAAGRRHVEQHYNIRTEVTKLEERYFQLLEAAAMPALSAGY